MRPLYIGACLLLQIFWSATSVAQMPHGPAQEAEAPLDIPVTREASGTSWQPDFSPMLAWHFPAGRWSVMVHGNLFAGWDEQGSRRGDGMFTVPNWAMVMGRRPFAGGLFTARMMASLEPLVMPPNGYPLLLQSGETAGGEALHDRQHPHELFMEVAVEYSRPLTRHLAFQVYAAPSGEPAIGPVAFPHRISAFSDPLAPLGHHWQDASHISYGVVTGGLFTRHVKAEGSVFNGREPDENRIGFDLAPLDSWSARFQVNPHRTLSAQVSFAHLNEPEALEPGIDTDRTTASATWHVPAGDGLLATTLVFGRNRTVGHGASESWLLESRFAPDGRNVVFGRIENVVKSGHDLVLAEELENERFVLNSFVLGYEREFAPIAGAVPALGGRCALNFLDPRLEPYYGDASVIGGMVFLHLHPAAAGTRDHAMHSAQSSH